MSNACTSNIVFNGNVLQSVASDVHLGNTLGPNVDRKRVDSVISDMYGQLNKLLTSFGNANTYVKYTLFRSYCMSAYGSQLWDFSGKNCIRFYTAWRQCVRRIYKLPPLTHCHLLPYICSDIPPEI